MNNQEIVEWFYQKIGEKEEPQLMVEDFLKECCAKELVDGLGGGPVKTSKGGFDNMSAILIQLTKEEEV